MTMLAHNADTTERFGAQRLLTPDASPEEIQKAVRHATNAVKRQTDNEVDVQIIVLASARA